MKKGEDYNRLPKTVTIIITGYRQFLESNAYRHRFHWWEDEQPILLSERQEIIFLDLVMIRRLCNRGLLGDKRKSDRSIKWMLFLLAKENNAIAREVEEMGLHDPTLEKAIRDLERISSDPKVIAEYEARLKYEYDQAAMK
ncbi:PD-(D/E)XK nuclease family transposase protein [Heliorestis convoluta]|uniref:PD-(D/E)XK nuclease family transposase protein n=1 Tax=Heliorestis convoluta TaxID=356322 RepID=A0A5Q2MVW1_9FIRM|nr:PD-(D/E)XK nuclease family transposase protein [Heliorestis convoluta]